MEYKQCLKELSDNPVNINSLLNIKIDKNISYIDEISYIVYFIFLNVKLNRLTINKGDAVYTFIYNVIIYLETLDNINAFDNTNIYFLYYMCFNINIKFNNIKYNLKIL